ncbi:MAG: hypothetical protein ABEJ23_05750 [Haloarculaceae archaeon]
MDIEDLLKLILALVIVWLVLEILGDVVGLVARVFGSILGLVIIAVIALYLLDRI